MICMLLDHVGLALLPQVQILRILGRISLPIFAYMIAEGCKYTKNRKRYFGIIFAMAFVFQLVYLVFMNDLYQGILVTFSLSIAIIFSVESFFKNPNPTNRLLMLVALTAALCYGLVCPVIWKQYGFAIDYRAYGIFLPVIIYFTPKKVWKITFTALAIIVFALCTKPIHFYQLLAIPLLILYNGERGNAKLKYMFYIFYPLHLVLIYAIMYLIVFLRQI